MVDSAVQTQPQSQLTECDMSRAIYLTLCEAGLVSEHFYDVQRCTVGEVDTFFSYRAEHGQCGRHGAIAFMSDK